jgi:hypothetical protein
MKTILLLLTLCVPQILKAQTDTTAKLDGYPNDQTVTIEFKSDFNRQPVFEMYVDPIRFENLSKSEKMQIIHNLERWILIEKRKMIPKLKEELQKSNSN